nr:MAG: 1-acyl-sn-glycerol-3-phosphate acyltransferase [Leptolyngbya sp. IPPAS B-1204]
MLVIRSLTSALLTHTQSSSIDSRPSPWMTPLAYALGSWVVLPSYFRIHVTGQENVPRDGAVILAPTHRSRWDALVVPYAAGRFATGRDIRFMVTADEVKGLQGWLIRHLGGFPVNPRQPAIASLRHGLEILQNREMLVIFPEGGIFRDKQVHPLKPGLARLALQAEASQPDLTVQVVPVYLDYSQAFPTWGCKVNVRIGKPLQVADYTQGKPKSEAQRLTADLATALKRLAGIETEVMETVNGAGESMPVCLQHGQMHG